MAGPKALSAYAGQTLLLCARDCAENISGAVDYVKGFLTVAEVAIHVGGK
jgi:hypothetical protein